MKAFRLRKKDLPPDTWPFTIPSVRIERAMHTNALYVKANNTTYALNGIAIGSKGGEDIRPIWADNPRIKGAKMSLKPVFDYCIKVGVLR